MKVGMSFSPYENTYGRYGENKFLKLRQHGYDAVDYLLADTNNELYSLNEKEAEKIIEAEKRAFQTAGIEISQVHGPWRFPPKDTTQEEREERFDKMKRAVLITAMLKSKYLVVHPLMPFGIEDLKCGKECETWALNLSFFKELVAYAKQYGVIICLENMPMCNFSIAKPEKILEFVKEINDDNFKICLDTGHVAVFPELTVGNEVRRLGSYIKVLHIHDNMGDWDSHLYPQKGIIDWSDFIDSLDEIGFNGVLSLETSPSKELDDDAFEKESTDLCKTFRELVSADRNKDI